MDPTFLDGQGDNGQIDLSLQDGAEQILFKIFLDIDLKVWIALLAPDDQGRQEKRSQGRNRPDGDPALQRRRIAHLLSGRFDFEKDSLGPIEKNRPGFGEHRAASKSVEKLVPELLFQIHNLLT